MVGQRTWDLKGKGLEQAWFLNLVFYEDFYLIVLLSLCCRGWRDNLSSSSRVLEYSWRPYSRQDLAGSL